MREALWVNALTAFERRPHAVPARASACPGLMRIVPARDGGLARLRLAGGVLSADAAHAVAQAARLCGAGIVEVTNRANLQLRGIRDDAHEELIAIALDAGLGPSTADGDDLRNVMLSPLASDGTRALATRIVEAMQADAAMHALSPKFALQLDDGERLAMLDHPHDVWLSALDDARFAFGFAGTVMDRADGAIARADAVRFVMNVLHAFLALANDDEHRMRDLLARIGKARFLDALDAPDAPISTASTWRRAYADASLRLGAHAEANADTFYVGAQTRLGRLDAATLDALAMLSDTHALGRLVMTPWQSVLIPGVVAHRTRDVLQSLHALGLAIDLHDPFARLVACAGSAGCIKGRAATKADAHRLAPLLPANRDVHLSGCERACAAAHPVETTLYAVAPGRYDLHRDARCIARNLTIEEAAAWLARSHTDV
jgi:precorrin-3B synthase